ncbi:sensor histidine kinase [Bacillus sp. RAR_GA_16]|uniref:HAMP domain-containing sensor histidine kinase n=1 Tax=Bacillus sp. RAR_GA_16 TaxID=2876774 RepID=UPI001CCAEF34|nr:HAMP domain-containing sensor histidine kinase [Bacillus sp. RAR_GA_16]MCA0172699.1 HAMP domain-containing histidine kinase [Bacillus sp. RAR_GA_16]
MKLRTMLMIANGISITIILIFLIISYVRMVLSPELILTLTVITIGAGSLSMLAHFFFTSQILKSVNQMTEETSRIADGKFDVTMSEKGPIEIQELAQHFNVMSEKLNQMFSELKRSEEYKTELIANVSHDLRTPVSSIRSFAEALQDGVVTDKKTERRYLETIERETERLSHLIEELLTLSQLESGTSIYEPEWIHPDVILVDTLQQFDRRIQERDIDLSVDIEDKLGAIPMMPDQIKRVLTNLIQNAIAFSPDHSTISISLKQVETVAVFIIKDQGSGISEKEVDRVFDRFYRVEKSRNTKYGGSGLGLAISRQLVELHGGKIGVESSLGEGSEFWFMLPLDIKEE